MTLEELRLRIEAAFPEAEVIRDEHAIRCSRAGLLGDRKLGGFDAWPNQSGRGGYFMRPDCVGRFYVDRERHNRWVEEIRERIDGITAHALIAARRRMLASAD